MRHFLRHATIHKRHNFRKMISVDCSKNPSCFSRSYTANFSEHIGRIGNSSQMFQIPNEQLLMTIS